MSADFSSRRLHFVGIGGAGMSGLALVAKELGAQVTGSDRSADSTYIRTLREHGIQPLVGHDAANVPADAEVVYSTAVAPENPERSAVPAARQLHRAELLSRIAQLKRCIAVTGTHGKTTTTAMIVHILRRLSLDPAYVVGAELRSTGLGAAWGSGEWIVLEADESDRSLLEITPEIVVLTNAELDHHSTYSSQQDLEETFRRFIAAATGRAVVWDRPELRALCPPDAVPYAPTSLELVPEGSRFCWLAQRVRLTVAGEHNAINAAGALSACVLAGVQPTAAAAVIEDFAGARRRLERVGRSRGGAAVIDDYAHHPTEVAAAIAAARSFATRRLVAVFQPHLFSRTQALADEFGAALAAADVAAVLPIYPARERAEDFPGIDGRMLAAATADRSGGRAVMWLPSFRAAHRALDEVLGPEDVCLLMGAGNIDALARSLIAEGPG